jgi:hypothetical protein
VKSARAFPSLSAQEDVAKLSLVQLHEYVKSSVSADDIFAKSKLHFQTLSVIRS